jgi:hypothetical protein
MPHRNVIVALLALWHCLAAAAGVTSPAATAVSRPALLESPAMRAALGADGALTLEDRISGVKWESVVPVAPKVILTAVTVEPGASALRAAVEIDGASWQLELRLHATEAVLDLELGAPAGRVMTEDLAFPFPWRAPSAEWRAVLPQKTGVMFRPADAANPKVLGRYWTFDGPGLTMPWYGLSNLQAGLMVLFLTPEDSGLQLGLTAAGGAGAFTTQPVWRPSLGTVRYPRKLQVRLLPEGGYVAMAKRYRQHLIERGEFVTLRQKAVRRPAVAKLMGAMDVHLRAPSPDEQRALVEYLEGLGVAKMFLNTGGDAALIAWMKARGHLVGSYRIYTDIHPPQGDRPARGEIYSRGYPDDAYTLPDGGPTRGFGFSETRRTTYRSSVLQMPLMAEMVPPLLHENGYEAIFLDVTGSLPLKEDYHPQRLLDRAADRAQRRALLQYTAAQNVVTGTEDGQSWTAPDVDYFEGMNMPRRFGYMPGITVGNFAQSFDLNAEYKQIDLNEAVRVPLWDLVYHDSVVSTWRWNFGRNRYSDPAYWEKHDLLEILLGNMPIFLLNADLARRHGARLAQTYRDVCTWQGRVGWDELVDHRALTPDRAVQESRFSSGWAVTVNFSERAYQMSDGSTLGPRSFATRRSPADSGAAQAGRKPGP